MTWEGSGEVQDNSLVEKFSHSEKHQGFPNSKTKKRSSRGFSKEDCKEINPILRSYKCPETLDDN